jgi:hypothetical protein
MGLSPSQMRPTENCFPAVEVYPHLGDKSSAVWSALRAGGMVKFASNGQAAPPMWSILAFRRERGNGSKTGGSEAFVASAKP